MANYVCYPVTKIEPRFILNVEVPTGLTYHAGQIVALNSLVATSGIKGNKTVFAGSQPLTADLDSVLLGIVISDGFETLSDGRRPDGNPNFTEFTFDAGEIVTVIALDKYMRFVISEDSITEAVAGDFAEGSYLYPTNASNNLTADDTESVASVSTQLKLLSDYDYPIGGQFGANFVDAAIAIVL